MKAFLKQNAFLRFAVVSGLMYFSLYIVYQFIVKKHTYYDQQFIGLVIRSSESFLRLLGYQTFCVLQDQDLQVVGIDGSNGVWVGSNCNAIKLFSLFAVFIIAYPGNQKNKIWFVPLGILAIHTLNILRVTALAIIAKSAPQLLNFNHTYTFTFLIYAFIFLLWMIWVNKFSSNPVSAA